MQRTSAVWLTPALARLVVRKLDASRCETMMLIEGMHCSACAWLIEHAIVRFQGSTGCRSTSGRAARVIWHAGGCSLTQILEVVARARDIALCPWTPPRSMTFMDRNRAPP
jgi:hypothetical protein